MLFVIDYFGNKLLDEIDKKFKGYLNKKGLHKILLACLEDAGIEIDEGIREKVHSIKPDKIKPNMFREELEENLKDVFDYISNSNEKNRGILEEKKGHIFSEYIKRAGKDILELYNILDAIDDVKEDTTFLVNNTSKKVDDLYSELRLIDELDNIRVFYYFRLEIVGDYLDNGTSVFESLNELLENLYVDFDVKHEPENDVEGFYTVGVQFFEPVLQENFRTFLKEMNSSFSEKEILISKITSHF